MKSKNNPWAICHASTGPKKTKKFERCVKKVKEKEGMKEEDLTGNQDVLDSNKNGKLDSEDFKILRKKKVKKARESLAERFLKELKASIQEEDDPSVTTPASIEQAGGDPKQYKREKAKKDPKKITKSKNLKKRKNGKKRTRLSTLGQDGGKHRKDGTPVKVSSNHPVYLKKKLYNRGVKGKGYGKKGDSKKGMPIEKINQTGEIGNNKKIAKKKSDMKMDMMKQILAARKRKQARGKPKKLGSGTLATIARRAKNRSDNT